MRSLAQTQWGVRVPTRALLVFLLTVSTFAQAPAPDPANRANLTIAVEALGDTAQGVVSRLTFRFAIPSDVPGGVPLVIQGSLLQGGQVIRNFRLHVAPDGPAVLKSTQTLPEGEVQIEARLMIPLEEQSPVLLGKIAKPFTIARTNKTYIASEDDGAEGAIAEGVVPESVGAVRIRNPRRDVAPNLFIVDVEVKAPVKRVEFWVEGKKIMARSAPPYRAELDLGKLPKRVEVKAIGYDAQGRYVDADAFVVNERDTPLEVKITRTDTLDGIAHFKISLQNPRNTEIRSVVLYAGTTKIHEWKEPPYALDLPVARLQGVDFVRASAMDATNYEATDLLFLNGDRYVEEIEVNLVELPVSVTDSTGMPVTDLKQDSFTVLESGKQQKIGSFAFAANLPISVGVLLDHSGSMQSRIKDAKAAAIEFFRSIMKSDDRAFFSSFAFDSKNVSPFVSTAAVIEAQINASPDALGGTALYDAIVTGLYRFRGVQGRKALVVITDGEDTSSRLSYDEMLNYARAARVPLYFIGIGMGFSDMSGTSKMKSLAAESGGVAYFVRDAKHLKEAYTKLEGDLRSQYLLSYHAETSRRDQKYRPVEVKVDRPGVTVRTIRGYIP
jgi:Ca-activated chloride channel homolog